MGGMLFSLELQTHSRESAYHFLHHYFIIRIPVNLKRVTIVTEIVRQNPIERRV